MSGTKRIAHVLWHSQGGMRRHVRTIAARPPEGWTTHAIHGPADLAGYFDGLSFRGTGMLGLLRAGHDADVIHAHGVTAGTVAFGPTRPPVVTSLHVVVGGSGRTARSRWSSKIGRVIVNRADAVVAVSAAAAVGFPNATVVAPAFDPLPGPARDRADVRSDLGANADDVVVLCVSRLQDSKRIELLITAVQAAGCVGWVVGDGPDRERLAALARGSRTRLLGHRDDVAELLGAADVFALPSGSESYGIAVAEAVDAGLPVVATRTGAISDLVGEAGVIVDAGDDEGFFAAVYRLATDDVQRRRFASFTRGVARPDAATLIAELGCVYDEVLAGRRR